MTTAQALKTLANALSSTDSGGSDTKWGAWERVRSHLGVTQDEVDIANQPPEVSHG